MLIGYSHVRGASKILVQSQTPIQPGCWLEARQGRICLGKNCRICIGVVLNAGKGKIIIGDHVSINAYCCLYGQGKIINVQAHLIRGNVLELPLREAGFDLVFSAGLVEHFDPPTPLLRNAFQLLKPGGTAITTVPNKRGIASILDRWLHPETFWGHIFFAPEELAEAHRQSGFIPLHAQYVGCFYFGARAPAKGIFRLPYRIVRRLITQSLDWLMDTLRWYPESKTFSPSILRDGKPLLRIESSSCPR